MWFNSFTSGYKTPKNWKQRLKNVSTAALFTIVKRWKQQPKCLSQMNGYAKCELLSSDSLRPHGLWPARLLCPWNSPDSILKWVSCPFSRGSSWPRNRTRVSCIAGRFFTSLATRDAWINKMWYINTMINSAFKRKKILTHATAWMDPEDVILSEMSQPRKDKYCMIPHIDTWRSQIHRDRN